MNFKMTKFHQRIQTGWLLIGILLIFSTHTATQTPEAPPAAEPQNPPLVPPPDGYLSPDDALKQVRTLGAKVINIATTPEGREVLVAAFAEREMTGRPAILVVANLDGDRPGATQVAMGLCEHFAAGDSPLLEKATVYILPVANPDAAAHAFAGGDAWRGKPLDEDRDGAADEDGPDDLNSDGLALQMRVADPTGEWYIDETDPRLMQKAKRDAGESGGWRVLREGIDNDGDREFNEDAPGNVQLEANFPHRWREHQPNAGRFQLSEPESHGLADFVLAHPNIALVVVLGAEDNLSTPPKGVEKPDPQSTEPIQEDVATLKLFADQLLKDVENKPRSNPHGHGVFADWVYYQLGAFVLESAVWSPPLDVKTDEKKEDGEKKLSDDAKLLRWNDQSLGGAGFVPWMPFEHPELGTVEIGGWKPLVLKNPPASEIEPLSQRWIEFLDSLSNDFARLTWENAEIKALGGGVFDARITLVNRGLLPTTTRMGEINGRPLPIRVTLEFPEGGELLVGNRVQSVSRLKGLGAHREFRWVYRLPEGSEAAKVRAVSQTAGEVNQAIKQSSK
jgi:hypothetical protein